MSELFDECGLGKLLILDNRLLMSQITWFYWRSIDVISSFPVPQIAGELAGAGYCWYSNAHIREHFNDVVVVVSFLEKMVLVGRWNHLLGHDPTCKTSVICALIVV